MVKAKKRQIKRILNGYDSYEYCEKEKVYIVSKQGRFGLISYTGQKICGLKFLCIERFGRIKEGVAFASKQVGNREYYIFIDAKGNEVYFEDIDGSEKPIIVEHNSSKPPEKARESKNQLPKEEPKTQKKKVL